MKQNIELKNSNVPIWLGLTRIVLGMLLIWKGLLFTQDASELQVAIEQTGIGAYAGSLDVIAAVVSILTFVTGIFIMVGLFTRVASYMQIAMIMLAVVFIYYTGIERNSFEVISTVVILFLLAFVGKSGGGTISFDEVISDTFIEQSEAKQN